MATRSPKEAPTAEQKGEYPVRVLQRLEHCVVTIRNRVMDVAAEKAQRRQPEGDYTVTLEDQEAAMREVVQDPQALLELLNVQG